MNISELFTTFQKSFGSQERAAATEPPPAQAGITAPAAAAESSAAATDDIVTVSPQAVFLFAASQFDPRSITRDGITELADTLRDGGAISNRDHAILTSRPDPRNPTTTFRADFREPLNLIAEFQGRLSQDLAQSNVAAVEADTRALAILGRLSGIRDELL
ncbi:MAG: hypothetical protein WD767_20180 [Alphaproteobacteria bacterium]